MRYTKIAFLGMFAAFAMILSFVEMQIPAFVAIPGIKLGLPNIAVVLILYKIGSKEAVTCSFVRILLSNILFGSLVSFLYSAAGAALSLTAMIIMKKMNMFSVVTVSVVGGVTHNMAQIVVACLITETAQLLYYLPVLIISGLIAGIIIGMIAALSYKRLEKIDLSTI